MLARQLMSSIFFYLPLKGLMQDNQLSHEIEAHLRKALCDLHRQKKSEAPTIN